MRPEARTQRGEPEADTLIIGRVLKPHGVSGEMRVESLTDDPRRYRDLEEVILGDHSRKVLQVRTHAGHVLLKLEGVETPEDVQLLRGEYLRVPIESAAVLPEGSYYHYQLVGLDVRTTAGETLGHVVRVIPLEANDIYVVRGERGEILVPAVRDVVKEIDLEASVMVVEVVDGLLPWESE